MIAHHFITYHIFYFSYQQLWYDILFNYQSYFCNIIKYQIVLMNMLISIVTDTYGNVC